MAVKKLSELITIESKYLYGQHAMDSIALEFENTAETLLEEKFLERMQKENPKTLDNE